MHKYIAASATYIISCYVMHTVQKREMHYSKYPQQISIIDSIELCLFIFVSIILSYTSVFLLDVGFGQHDKSNEKSRYPTDASRHEKASNETGKQ